MRKEDFTMDTYKIGQVVQNFEMDVYDPIKRDFGKISFDEVKGKKQWLILFFYPADFTFICPTELKDLADKHKELKSAGCEVVSVSTDTKYSHLAWQQSERLLQDVKYLMGADPTGTVSRLFGVYGNATGPSLRASLICRARRSSGSWGVTFYNVGRN